MKYTSELPYGEEPSPKPLIYLIISIGTISLAATLFNGLFAYFFNTAGPETWLGLSLHGMQNFLLFEPLTYLFTQSSDSFGISISYLISLSLNLYILWLLGSSIIERTSLKSFFTLFFFSGVVSGVMAFLAMKLTADYLTLINGPIAPLLALLTFWTLLFHEADIRFMFLVQIKAKWLTAGIFIALLLSSLSQFNLVYLVLYLTAFLSGYLYGILYFDLKSPFAFLAPFDKFMLSLFKRKNKDNEAKIIDIKTGRAEEDEIFLDRMLAKISKQGEDSLSYYERKRLDQIAKGKK